MAEYTIRGSPQFVHRVNKGGFWLHDPLLTTVLDFDRRALDQLAHGLHLTVCEAYNHARGINKHGFFMHQGKPANPSTDEGGLDVYALLKNIQHNADKYAELLNQSEEDVEEIASFLVEKIRNQMAHQSYLRCPELANPASISACAWDKIRMTEKCMDKCTELLQWVVDAEFFEGIQSEVGKPWENINNMKAVFRNFKQVQQSMKDRESCSADTVKATNLLTNLLEVIEDESENDEDERPVTHLINMVLAPRLKEIR